MFFALFVVPVLATFLFRHGYQEWENPLLALVPPVYAAIFAAAPAGAWLVLAVVVALLSPSSFVAVLPRAGHRVLAVHGRRRDLGARQLPRGNFARADQRASARRLREILLEFPESSFVTMQVGPQRQRHRPLPAQPHRNDGRAASRATSGSGSTDKQELVAALGDKLRDEFPTTRFNFTQPIIDSVTEDTNGTSANLAVEFSGPDSDVLLKLARKTVNLLHKVPGAIDVSIEQEGPQPQLVIVPDRGTASRARTSATTT